MLLSDFAYKQYLSAVVTWFLFEINSRYTHYVTARQTHVSFRLCVPDRIIRGRKGLRKKSFDSCVAIIVTVNIKRSLYLVFVILLQP